jgi:hypothetical protein
MRTPEASAATEVLAHNRAGEREAEGGVQASEHALPGEGQHHEAEGLPSVGAE